ncbi:MAG: aldo/keto reductase [Chloroflexi bacterium]|nr:aldo/keto reductase [Chloroflexota bacterium]MDA1001786.1 aldo/keto reductase [Chloroflexota bacterium]
MTGQPMRELGRTGVQVTTLGYGAMELRGGSRGREIPDEQAERVLNAVLDAGINFVDTSPDYGRSEELIGRFIAHRRDEYFLATKCGCMVAVEQVEGGPRHVYTRENIRAAIEQSLRRMHTDRLDLVQFHGSPSKAELEEHGGLDELQALQREGKVRFIGASSTLPHLADHIAMGVFDEFQIPYSALQREHEAAISAAARAGAGTVIRGGVARGAPSEDKQWGTSPVGASGPAPKDLWEHARLDEILPEGMSRMEFTLRFTLSHPDLHTTIVGTANPEHLAQNLAAAANGPLPADLYDDARARLATAGSAPAGS